VTANQEHLRRSKEFEAAQNRLRANQIETMIAEFDRMCIDFGHQIESEETRVQIYDPTHFAYPTYAKAVRERRAKLQRSTDALKIELDRLRVEASEASNHPICCLAFNPVQLISERPPRGGLSDSGVCTWRLTVRT
jgi:hypothetical protein